MLVIALVGGVVALVFSGAGVSKEEFISKADEICASVGEKTAELTAPTDLATTGDFFEQVIPLLREETGEIRALEAPEEDRETLDAWLATQERLAVTFQEAVDAANDDDQDGFDAAFTEANQIQSESSRLASQYGFNVCGISAPS